MLFKTRSLLAMAHFVKTLQCRKKIALLCTSRIQEFSSADTSHEQKSSIFATCYTEEQQMSILQTINTCSINELKRYNITEARLRKLISYRERYGSFQSISDVLLLQGMDISVLYKFCKSLVKAESGPRNKLIKTKGDVVTPALSNDIRAAINTITGIWIYGSVISWAQVDTSCNLLQWECESLGDVSMKDSLVRIVEAVAGVVSKLPVSHAYIMESDPIMPFSRMNSSAYYLNLQRQQIVSTIVSLLGTREQRFGGRNESNTLINNVYMMRSRTPARLFNLLIGSEVVSAASVVEKMIVDEIDNDSDVIIHFQVDVVLKESYNSRDIYQREQMNWALLLASAFVNLLTVEASDLKKTATNA